MSQVGYTAKDILLLVLVFVVIGFMLFLLSDGNPLIDKEAIQQCPPFCEEKEERG